MRAKQYTSPAVLSFVVGDPELLDRQIAEEQARIERTRNTLAFIMEPKPGAIGWLAYLRKR